MAESLPPGLRIAIYSPLSPELVGGFHTWIQTFWQPYVHRIKATLRIVHADIRPVAEVGAYRSLPHDERIEVTKLPSHIAVRRHRWPRVSALRSAIADCDVVYFDNGYQFHDALLLAALRPEKRALPVISGHHAVIVHQEDPGLMSRLHNIMWSHIGSRLIPKFSAAHVLNDADGVLLQRAGAKNVHMIPIEIDRRPHKKKTRFTVSFIGRLTTQKGIDRLVPIIRAAKHRYGDDLDFCIAGAGPDIALLNDLPAADYTYFGALDHARVLELLAQSHAVLAPSRSETFGILINEAVASGTPVIASKLPSLLKVLEQGGGLAVENPDHIDEWLQAIDMMYHEFKHTPALYQQRCERSVRYANAVLSFDAVAGAFDSFLAKVLAT